MPKSGKRKKDALTPTSGKNKVAEFHTRTWWEPAPEYRVASVYSSVDGGNLIFRKNGVKLNKNQNGLTSLRAPRFVGEIFSLVGTFPGWIVGTSASVFWPALFPDKILALRHRVFVEKGVL